MSKTKISKDVLSEMLTGEKGAVRCIGKFYISPRMSEIEGMPLVMIAGAVVSPEGGKLVLPENEEHAEMWECEVIIIPRRKYSGMFDNRRDQRFGSGKWAYEGYRVDQVLCSNYGDPEAWGDEYFQNKKSNHSPQPQENK